MVGYSGVDLAVHTAAGPELDKECQRVAPLGLGTAKLTKAYKLFDYIDSKGIYDVFAINEALFEFDHVLPGC